MYAKYQGPAHLYDLDLINAWYNTADADASDVLSFSIFQKQLSFLFFHSIPMTSTLTPLTQTWSHQTFPQSQSTKWRHSKYISTAMTRKYPDLQPTFIKHQKHKFTPPKPPKHK